MKKNAFILILAILMLAFFAGCKSGVHEEPVQSHESTKQDVNWKQGEKNDSHEVNLNYGDITDPVELEKLWQEYLYDTISSIGNNYEFNSAIEIDPLDVARFCKEKYVAEYSYEDLKLESKNSTRRLLPLDTILEYAERYFNLTSLDVTKIQNGNYDPEKHAFIFAFSDERKRPAHTDSNNFGIYLVKATKSSNGTVTAVLAQHDYPQTDRIVWTMTYTFKQRKDGSLYFVSGKRDYINNRLVAITGDYQRFDRITGFEGDMQYLSMIDEFNNRMIILYTPYEESKNSVLMLVNLNTLTVEKKLELNDEISSGDVSLNAESIIIRLKDRFIIVDKTLEQKESFSLPKEITDKINRQLQYDDRGKPEIFFGGYDVSGDRKRYVYADETGVKLFNTIDSSEKLLSKSVPITGIDRIDKSFHLHPRFVDDEQKVITTMTGYESAMGYTLCDLQTGTVKAYNIGSETSSTGLIRYDTGLMEIHSYVLNHDEQTADYKTMYLDFSTGVLHEIHIEDPGESWVVMPDQRYIGRNFAAFITSKDDRSDKSNNMYYLNRLNLTTMLLEPKIITIKAAQAHILGVLSDGRIMFWYSLNPSEEGICIAK